MPITTVESKLSMCGIAGYAHREELATKVVLERMGQTMKTRGPDDVGYLIDGVLGFVHRRLSIVDLEGGRNPIPNEDKTIWAMLNGEIYNFRELRGDLQKKGHIFTTKTDTEVIVHLYEEYGLKLAEYLNGMFAIALWDKNTNRVVLIRDRLGQKPLYILNDDKSFAFASELRAIECLPNVELTIASNAILQFLRYQYVPSPLSIYTEVTKLPPGTLAVWCSGKVEITKYWSLNNPNSDYSLSDSDRQEKFEALLESSVGLRMMADVPVGSLLSGGLDSSYISALMTCQATRKVKTFSIGFAESSFDESDAANGVANQLDTEHFCRMMDALPLDDVDCILDGFGEPFGDPSALPTYYLCQMAAEHVKVVLSGDGADELLGGYNRYRLGSVLSGLNRLPATIRKPFFGLLARRLPESQAYYASSFSKKIHHASRVIDTNMVDVACISPTVFTPSELKRLLVPDKVGMSLDPVLSRDRESLGIPWPQNMMLADCRSYLPDNILVKVDRMSMAHGLEVRSPFMDYRFVEFATSLPAKEKLHKGVSKVILRTAAGSKVPQVANVSKHGFEAPISVWFKEGLAERLRQMIYEVHVDVLNSEFMIYLLDEHIKGNRDYSKKLWVLFCLLQWLQRTKSMGS